MGDRTYEVDASPSKIAYEESKFKFQKTFGFRIQGMKIFDRRKHQYRMYDKHFGRQLTDITILSALELYFGCDENLTPESQACKVAIITQVGSCNVG